MVLKHEGIPAVKEAIQFLKNLTPMNGLYYEERMQLAARKHADRIGDDGFSDIGEDTKEKNLSKVDENIKGVGVIEDTATDIVLNLVIDDGEES